MPSMLLPMPAARPRGAAARCAPAHARRPRLRPRIPQTCRHLQAPGLEATASIGLAQGGPAEDDLAALLRDGSSHFYVCGLKSMEEGVVLALRDIATAAGIDWPALGAALKREGRLHLETY